MHTSIGRIMRLTIALAIAVAGASQPAMAQLPQPTPPPYAKPSTDQTIRGRIMAIDGPFNLRVRDDKGYIDSVELHRGTIINPTGLRLAVAMRVKILGYNAGAALEANEIDTPYTYAGPPPIATYYGPGWWYPGYAFGYGPAFSLNIRAGGGFTHGSFPHQYPIVAPPNPRPHAGGPFTGTPPGGQPPPGRHR
jgi:hypothetical protein